MILLLLYSLQLLSQLLLFPSNVLFVPVSISIYSLFYIYEKHADPSRTRNEIKIILNEIICKPQHTICIICIIFIRFPQYSSIHLPQKCEKSLRHISSWLKLSHINHFVLDIKGTGWNSYTKLNFLVFGQKTLMFIM